MPMLLMNNNIGVFLLIQFLSLSMNFWNNYLL